MRKTISRSSDSWHDAGVINIDLIIAMSLFILVFSFVFYTLAGAVVPYTAEYNRIYPIAARTADVLVKDPGLWDNGTSNGTHWEAKWGTNQLAVKRIGFAVEDRHNILNETKMNALMSNHTGGNLTWWEYPVDGTGDGELKNATRAIGLAPYNFYIQIRPINASAYNVTKADANITKTVYPIGDVVQIERFVMMIHGGRADEYQMLMWVW